MDNTERDAQISALVAQAMQALAKQVAYRGYNTKLKAQITPQR